MRQNFRGYYSLKNDSLIRDIWNSETTTFIFDTNCLLNLYRCEDSTREDILSVMEKISSRIWIPFYVCLEYQKNRRGVISESIDNLKSISTNLQNTATSITSTLSKGKVKKHLYSSLSESVQELQDRIKPIIDSFIADNIDPRIESKEQISKRDSIRDILDEIIKNNCGETPTQDWINDVNSLGLIRYNKQLPPGFKDADKKEKKIFFNLEFEEKYGDLYIWREIIEKSKNENVKSIIFVCDDNKEDWWYKKNGITHGALEYLQTEIYHETGIDNFKLISQASFLKDAQDYLPNIKINPESLDEIQDLSEYYHYHINNTRHSDNFIDETKSIPIKDTYILKNSLHDSDMQNYEFANTHYYLISNTIQKVRSVIDRIDNTNNLLTLLPEEQFSGLEIQIKKLAEYSNELYEVHSKLTDLYNELDYMPSKHSSNYALLTFTIQQAEALINSCEELLSFFYYFFRAFNLK